MSLTSVTCHSAAGVLNKIGFTLPIPQSNAGLSEDLREYLQRLSATASVQNQNTDDLMSQSAALKIAAGVLKAAADTIKINQATKIIQAVLANPSAYTFIPDGNSSPGFSVRENSSNQDLLKVTLLAKGAPIFQDITISVLEAKQSDVESSSIKSGYKLKYENLDQTVRAKIQNLISCSEEREATARLVKALKKETLPEITTLFKIGKLFILRVNVEGKNQYLKLENNSGLWSCTGFRAEPGNKWNKYTNGQLLSIFLEAKASNFDIVAKQILEDSLFGMILKPDEVEKEQIVSALLKANLIQEEGN